MKAEQNQRITQVGPGTPGGELLRRYWQPVALLDEFNPALDPAMGVRPVKAVRVLGQDFVLFRNAQGAFGLLDRDCPHRGADLAYGRNEGDGLRCPFHGWKFDVSGQCTETPAEPAGSTLCTRIRQRSYPLIERIVATIKTVEAMFREHWTTSADLYLPGGTLPVAKGDEVVPVINRIATAFENVVVTQDWHTPGHASFASTHAGKKPFEGETGYDDIRTLFVIAGNPVLSAPNGERTEAALAGLDLMVAMDMHVTETSRHAHYILPPCGPLEKDHFSFFFGPLAVRNFGAYSPPTLPMEEGAKADWEIASELAAAIFEARGKGVGRALIEDLATLARAAGWKRLYWNTEITNAAARKLYDSFTPDDGHIRYRLTL